MKVSDYDPRNVPPEQIDFNDEVKNILNYGKTQLQIVSSVPTWRGRKGEMAFVMAASGVFFVCTTDNSTTWKAVVSFSL